MPLTLVTGPANAAKAGAVLGGLRARLGDEPILVVPAYADVEHAQRELAERGAVFGAAVFRFDRLFRTMAARAGYGEPVASRVQRELILEAAVRRARLDVLAESAERPGFAARRRGSSPSWQRRCGSGALHPGAARLGPPGAAAAYAEEVAGALPRLPRALAAAGLVDPELFAWRALDAVRREARLAGAPRRCSSMASTTSPRSSWTRSRHWPSGSASTDGLPLPFEAGRVAFRAVAGVHARLSEIATERRVLDALDDHYAERSRPALHHLERELFEPRRSAPVEAGEAIAFHTAGGERAELELAGARVIELLRQGFEPGEVAVVLREPGQYASLWSQVFGAYGDPVLDRSLAPTRPGSLGRGLLALLRCAGPGGAGGRPACLCVRRTADPTGARRPPGGRCPPRGAQSLARARELLGGASAGRSRSSTTSAAPPGSAALRRQARTAARATHSPAYHGAARGAVELERSRMRGRSRRRPRRSPG